MESVTMSRDLRVADFVRDEVAQILQTQMRDPRVGAFVSVSDVRVSKDLSYAEIYVSSLDVETAEQKTELVDVLNSAAGFFRSELAKRHKMRNTPRPRFHYDELLESGPRLEKLIADAVAEDTPQQDQDG
jgi:ribosome-binding factor A